MIRRKTPLRRSRFNSPRARISPVSKRRAPQLRAYSIARKRYLAEHPICEVWCSEKGWQWYAPGRYRHEGVVATWDAEACFLRTEGAPLSVEIHHRKGRVGALLLDERWWFAISRQNHDRIHANPKEARERGWLL